MSIFKKIFKTIKQPSTIVGLGLVAALFGADPKDIQNAMAVTGIIVGGADGASIIQNAGLLIGGGLIAHNQNKVPVAE